MVDALCMTTSLARRTYVNALNLSNEIAMAGWLLQEYERIGRVGWTAKKMGKYDPADFVLCDERGRRREWVEIKCRDYRHDDFATYTVSEEKLQKLLNCTRLRGLMPVLLVAWQDGVGWANAEAYWAAEMRHFGGRWDRKDPKDKEWMRDAPIADFRLFTGRPPVVFPPKS